MAPPSALHFQSHQLAGLEVLAGLEPASLSLQPSFPVVAKRQACSTRPSFPAVAKRLTPSAPRIAVMSSGSVLPPVGAAASMDGTASLCFQNSRGGDFTTRQRQHTASARPCVRYRGFSAPCASGRVFFKSRSHRRTATRYPDAQRTAARAGRPGSPPSLVRSGGRARAAMLSVCFERDSARSPPPTTVRGATNRIIKVASRAVLPPLGESRPCPWKPARCVHLTLFSCSCIGRGVCVHVSGYALVREAASWSSMFVFYVMLALSPPLEA